MRIAIACGGSGGHLFPGLAVAEALSKRGHEILLLVSEKEIDAMALKAHPEFRFEKLPVIGLPAVLSPDFVRFLQRAWEGFSRCRAIFRRYRTSAVLSMGGFTSTAPLVVAKMAGIPTFIHESNSIPGRANRWGARLASRILLGFAQCQTHFPKSECIVTGTPVRSVMAKPLNREEVLRTFRLDPLCKTLLVTGGSQGASGLNQLLFRAAALLRDLPLQIIHLTGERDDGLAAANYMRENISAYVVAFHHRMEEVLSCADVVVSRAGASSLSELSYFGLPSILIPYPFATDNHQQSNAEVFVQAGAAEMLLESKTSPEALARLITDLMNDDQRRKKMAKQAREVFPHDAAQRIVTVIEEIAQ
ncbi:MAG: undecaprenyldiphospho-muramoylpentapeptide beta-N-acetylglucosaminyltransferase [Verrucomicrobia bacterium]|nr:MAG: undecaprenyldiphospho-muramoylpentapeptide beta-N-acetylglucosaminyltransferase [Verrucomicrobiota bacterium]